MDYVFCRLTKELDGKYAPGNCMIGHSHVGHVTLWYLKCHVVELFTLGPCSHFHSRVPPRPPILLPGVFICMFVSACGCSRVGERVLVWCFFGWVCLCVCVCVFCRPLSFFSFSFFPLLRNRSQQLSSTYCS